MKLTYSPASPYARKVRIAAIELGLIDKIAFVPTAVQPGKFNEDYSQTINPLRKLPALILDDGSTIVNSFVIAEYLDELAGGGKLFPASGPDKWKRKTEHSILQGMLEAMLLCRYEKMLRPEEKRWQTWYDDQWDRAWHGFTCSRPSRRRLRGRSTSPRSRWFARLAMPTSASPTAAGARRSRRPPRSTRR